MMTWILPLILSVIFQRAASQLSQISLSSSLNNGQRVCPGDEITFTCQTNGTASHAWTSAEYIGRGGIQLEFSSIDNPGFIQRNLQFSPMGTFATLTAKLIEENETIGILESVLTVAVISNFQTSTVACVYVDTGIRSTESFQLPDAPGVPQDIEINERSRNSDGCTFSIQLMPPGNSNEGDIQHYNVTAFLLRQQITRGQITGTSDTFFVPGISNCTTDLRVRVQAVNRCGMPGNITEDLMPIFLQPEPTTGDIGLPVGLGVTFGVIGIVLVTVVVVTIIIIVYKMYCGRRMVGDDLEMLPNETQHTESSIESRPHSPQPVGGPPPLPSTSLNKDELRPLIQELIQEESLKSIIRILVQEKTKTE